MSDLAPRPPRRRALLGLGAATLAAVALPALAQTPPSRRQPQQPQQQAVQPLSAQDQADIARIEQYFNSIGSAQARFAQTNPNGSVAQGTFYIRRPGRLRFEYDPPSKLRIVADGNQVTLYDPATRDFSQWPIGWTAASFLVAKQVQLSGDLTVRAVQRAPGLIALTMVQTKKPQEGRIEIVLSDNPLLLRRWTIWDAKNVPVQITLTDMRTGVNLSNDLFRAPEPSQREIR